MTSTNTNPLHKTKEHIYINCAYNENDIDIERNELENDYEFSDDDEVYSSDEIEQIDNETVKNKKLKMTPLSQSNYSYFNHNIFTNLINCCCLLNLSIILIGISLIYELVILIYAGIYKDKMNCSTNVVNPYIWLEVYACIGIISKLFSDSIKDLFFLFIFIWTIIGSVMFFRDCNGHLPKDINNLYHVIIILSYCGIGVECGKKSNEKK